ncbi:thioredoxin [Halobacteriales archaeon QS_1_68_20]|nr:MAG: thioredoxin [Halobacteriales archaeon QS_1_68_20]
MSDADSELEELRRKKLEELRESAEDGTPGADGPDGADDAEGQSATPDEPVYLEETDGFQSFVQSHDVVLVDFFADWCGPCKQMDPVVSNVAAETDAAVLKVDIDANQRLAAAQSVRSVPTLVLFADGEPAERLVGAQGERQLRSLIDRYA